MRRFFLVLGVSAVAVQADPALLVEDMIPLGGDGYVTEGDVTENRIHGKAPSETRGFSGPWEGSNALALGADPMNLSCGRLANEGGSFAVAFQGNYSRLGGRALAPYEASKVLWFAAVVRVSEEAVNAAAGSSAMLGFASGVPRCQTGEGDEAIWKDSNGGELSGFAWGMKEGALMLQYQAEATGGGRLVEAVLKEGAEMEGDTNYLLLARLESTGEDDLLKIWVLTEPPGDETVLGEPAFAAAGRIRRHRSDLTHLLLYFHSPSAKRTARTYFDALRVGTTLISVTPAS